MISVMTLKMETEKKESHSKDLWTQTTVVISVWEASSGQIVTDWKKNPTLLYNEILYSRYIDIKEIITDIP